MKSIYQLRSMWLVALLLISWLSSCSSKPESSVQSILGWEVKKTEITQFLDDELRDKDHPSLSVGLINSGKLVYTYHRGSFLSNVDTLSNDSSRFHLSSGSNPILYYFAMTYVDEGRLELDLPLSTYLKNEELSDNSIIEKITARSILANKAGIIYSNESGTSDISSLSYEAGKSSSDTQLDLFFLMKSIAAIEKITIDELDSIFQDRVALPLGMKNTHIIYDESIELSNFEVETTLLDYSKWVISIMKGQLLSKENMLTFLDPIEDVSIDSSDPYKITIGDYEFYSSVGDSKSVSRYVTFDKNIDWGLILFSSAGYAEEIGLSSVIYLVLGPKIKIVGYATAIVLIASIIGLIYGFFRLVKFIIN